MSDRDPPVQVSSELPDIIASAVKQAVDDSRGLGLTWSLRMATALTAVPLTIIYDGDTSTSNAISMIGSIDPNQRVYALLIPPSGNFIVGTNETTLSRGLIGANTTNNGIVVSTPAGGAETAVPSASWDSEPRYEFIHNRIYRVDMDGFAIESSGAATVSLIRVRKGAATTTGTQLGLKELFHPAGFGGFTQSFSYRTYFKNTTGQTVQSKLSLTINGVVGAGIWQLYGGNEDQLKMVVNDCGWVSDNATFASLLATI